MSTELSEEAADGETWNEAGRPVVDVVRDGQWVYFIDPPGLEELDVLRTVRHVVEPGGPRGPKLARKSEPLTRLARDWSADPSFLAGLEPDVYRRLIEAGHAIRRYVVTSPEPTPLPPPDLAAAGKLGLVDRPVLDFVRDRERGLILHGRGVNPGRLVAGAILAYPAATFAVVAARDDDVHHFFDRYRRFIPGLRWATAGSCPADVGRVVVATPFGLHHNQIKLRERDAVFALEAVEALGERPQLALQDAARGRIFGLLRRDRPLAPRDRDRLVPIFGLDALAVPRHGCVERPVGVGFDRFDGGPRPAPGLGGVDLLRQGVWEHPLRNRRVGRLARALAVGVRGRLEAGSPALAGATGGLPAYPSVVVLADCLEHALAVAGELEGWPIVVGPDARAGGLPPRLVERLAEHRWAGPGNPPLAVATRAGLASLDLGGVNALVRADGGVGLPPRLASIPADPGARPLLLVDVADRHHPAFRVRSRSRREAYSARGWPVDGVPAPTPVERFLAARPGRSR